MCFGVCVVIVWEIHNIILTAFPQLSNAGGYMFLIHAASVLVVIEPP